MKNQTLILLLVAGACGFVAMLGVKQYLSKQNQKEVEPTVQVLVASSPIKQGDPLNELNTQFVTMDQKSCPKGVVTSLEQIEERALKVPRGAGDWIMVDQLTEKGATGISAVIPNGMRVITIPVDATTHHSGMIRPGNRIDLLLTYRRRDNISGQQSQKIVPLLQYIEVFAVDDKVYGISTGGENAQARNISLLVTPEQMMKLTLAKKKGDISTVLRSSEDMDEINIAEMTEETIEGRGGDVISSTSTLDVESAFSNERFALPAEPVMTSLFQTEPQASAPVVAANVADDAGDFWTMAIYEAGAVRVEKVNLKSDEPIDTSASRTTIKVKPEAVPIPQPGLDDLDLESGGIEEAASSLMDLLN